KTVPYTQHGAGVKTIDLGKLFPAGTTQQKLTVEYTNNPAWLMVQSLPTVGQPSDHSAIELAASYYSNLLAKTLLAQSPQVKTVFAQWKQERTDNTLLSQLEKDQELKDLLLGETPWVAAADRETEQKQRLADFFDENGIHNRLSQTLEKLGKLQNADGSFSWYSGMQGSTSVTVAVEEMLVRLNSMAGEQPATKQLQAKAFGYLGKEMVQLVAELKKEERKGRRV
ncbi:MAG: alpha-2-macroglobulin, partial [Prevotella sp.]|nr:alpha-2-macroglobulin [Prevotella sp.]